MTLLADSGSMPYQNTFSNVRHHGEKKIALAIIVGLLAISIPSRAMAEQTKQKKCDVTKAKPYVAPQNCLHRNSDGSCKGGQPR